MRRCLKIQERALPPDVIFAVWQCRGLCTKIAIKIFYNDVHSHVMSHDAIGLHAFEQQTGFQSSEIVFGTLLNFFIQFYPQILPDGCILPWLNLKS